MTIRDCPPGCDIHYGCRLRAKGVAISAQATPTKTLRLHRPGGAVKPGEAPSWEKGIAGERMPDGSFSPLLNRDGTPVRSKQMAEKRPVIEREVRRLRQGA